MTLANYKQPKMVGLRVLEYLNQSHEYTGGKNRIKNQEVMLRMTNQ